VKELQNGNLPTSRGRKKRQLSMAGGKNRRKKRNLTGGGRRWAAEGNKEQVLLNRRNDGKTGLQAEQKLGCRQKKRGLHQIQR